MFFTEIPGFQKIISKIWVKYVIASILYGILKYSEDIAPEDKMPRAIEKICQGAMEIEKLYFFVQ
jgi:hypothetical protein